MFGAGHILRPEPAPKPPEDEVSPPITSQAAPVVDQPLTLSEPPAIGQPAAPPEPEVLPGTGRVGGLPEANTLGGQHLKALSILTVFVFGLVILTWYFSIPQEKSVRLKDNENQALLGVLQRDTGKSVTPSPAEKAPSLVVKAPAPVVKAPSARQADAWSSGSRVALVIGNARYPNADPPLTQPIGNARALGEELMRDGFQVDVGENLTKGAMQRAFGRLYDRIKPGTVALIFFSGYGIQSNGQSYMIPVDGQIYKEDDVRHDGISVDNVLFEMNNKGASVKIAILDASRRNRFEGNFRGAPLGLVFPANPPSGTLVMYSAASGSVVRDEANDRSQFVSELLKEMRAPGVPAEEVFTRTRMGVLRATQGEQNPSNYSSLNEDFTFSPQVPEVKPPEK